MRIFAIYNSFVPKMWTSHHVPSSKVQFKLNDDEDSHVLQKGIRLSLVSRVSDDFDSKASHI